jgi:CHAT domain-containing protein
MPSRIWCARIAAALFAAGLPGATLPPAAFAALQTAPDTLTPELRAIGERYLATIAAKDVKGFLSLFAPEAVQLQNGRRDSLSYLFFASGPVSVSDVQVSLVTGPITANDPKDNATVLKIVGQVRYPGGEDRQARLLRIINGKITGDMWLWGPLVMGVANAPAGSDAEQPDGIKRAAAAYPAAAGLAPNPHEAALIVREAANVLVNRDPERAYAMYERTRKEFEALGDRIGVADSLSGQATVRGLQNRFEDQISLIKQVLTLREQSVDKMGQVRAHAGLGAAYYYRNNLTEAREHFERAHDLAVEAGDTRTANDMLSNVAVMRDLMGDLNAAHLAYQGCLKLYEATGDKQRIAATLNNLSNIAKRQGKLREALALLDRSLKISEEIGDKESMAYALNNIGNLYQTQGDWAQSEVYLKRALALQKERQDELNIARVQDNLAATYGRWGKVDLAVPVLKESLAYYEGAGNLQSAIFALDTLATLTLQKGDLSAARDIARRSLTFAEKSERAPEIAETLLLLAEIEIQMKNSAEGAVLAQRSVDLARKIGLRETEAEALSTLGDALRQKEDIPGARLAWEQSAECYEKLRSDVAGGAQSRQRAFETMVRPYRLLVGLHLSLQNPAEALVWAERAKSRALLDILQDSAASEALDQSPELTAPEQAKVREIRNALVALNAQIISERSQATPDSAKVRDWEAQRQQLQLENEAYQTSLYAAHPRLQLRFGEVRPVTEKEAGALLPEDGKTALIEFVSLYEVTCVLVLTRGPQGNVLLTGYIIPLSEKALASRVEAYRSQMARRDLGFAATSRKLYDLLLKPAEAQLKGKTALVLVPDGPLWELPFQALQNQPGHYLSEDYALSSVPSLTALREMRARKKGTGASKGVVSLVAVGNPALPPMRPGTRSPGSEELRAEFVPLPKAETEVKALANLYGQTQSRLFVGAAAQEAAVKTAAQNTRVFHLATHGYLNDTSPLHSYVLLSQLPAAAGSATNEDGILEARELLGMHLNADLVVLSACETARGRIGEGEGLIGMSWALFAAGCPSTVVSQWKVDSASTSDLMIRFHKNLRQGMDKAHALQSAAATLRRAPRYRHPFYWAGFQVVGDYR